jgi:1-acyl-sn-glycerol-3-phosphate acyltransferase
MATHLVFAQFLAGFFKRIWFIFCALIFLLTGLVALLAYLLVFNFFTYEKSYRYAFYITKIWGKVLTAFMLIKIKTEGAEKLDPSQSYVIISNHQSATDIPLCMSVCPLPFSFLAKIEADKIPVVGYLARNMHIYVDRKSEESRQESFLRMKKHLLSGKSIHIYPEGSRNKSAELLTKFYDGAFKLAIETQKPLAILTLINAEKTINPREAFRASPAFVFCIWTEPIPTKGLTLDDLEMLKEKAFNQIWHVLNDYKIANIA